MAEVAQVTYKNALTRDVAVGEYPALPGNSIKVTEEIRLYMVTMIIELHRLKNYKEETLYLACSISDHYLAALVEIGKPSPCLIQLAIVSTLIAAKLEESMQPSFKRMVRLVQKEWGIDTTRESFVRLEEQIIHMLDFDFLKTGPLFYLERFTRLMNLDGERNGD